MIFSQTSRALSLPDRLLGLGMDQVVLTIILDRRHEGVGDRDRDIEVGDLGRVVLAGDEIHDIRMIHPQDAHVGAPTGAALLDHVGRRVVQAHEGDRTRGDAHRGADDVVLGPEPGEGEPGPSARLVDQGHRPEGVVDAVPAVGEGVLDRQDEAGGELPQGPARIHQGRRVGHEHPVRHQTEERLGHGLDGAGGRSISAIRLRHRPGHPPEQVGGLFDRLACVILDQVALFQHGESVGRELQGAFRSRGSRHGPVTRSNECHKGMIE